ncbi:MAG: restriction endonuclease subunit S [Verrucomicrobiales bacterium]
MPIADLIEAGHLLINDGYRAKNSELSPVGIPFARAGNINNGFHFEDADRVPDETLTRVGIKRSEPGDVVFTSKGTVGRFAFVREGTETFVYSPQLCFWRSRNRDLIDPGWLYYWMHGREFFDQYRGVAGQTDMAEYVSLRDQRKMHITIPPLPIQKCIAHILGTLDDKIELNRRTNATLEAMARALFRSWFVDFDPVRAKADGRQPPGLDPATAALFPDSFQDSDLGQIPEGWEVKLVRDIGAIVCGKTPSTKVPEYYGGDVPFVTIPDMHGNVFALETKRCLSTAGAESQKKKTLPPNSICVSCIATPGLTVVTTVPSHTNQQINSVIPTDPDATFFWYWSLKGLGDEIRAGGSGGSVLTNLSTGRFSELSVLFPSYDLRSAYQHATQPLFAKILTNENQSRTLAALRDTLLPKLLSGELDVSETEASLCSV